MASGVQERVIQMINNVTLVGRLTAKPELKFTPANKAVASFTLAVNRQFKTQDGKREADFINCIVWGQSAENLANWNDKGSLIGVVGRIQTRNYENQQGQRVYVTEVLVGSWQKLEFGQNQGNNQGQQAPQQQAPTTGYNQNPFGNTSPMDISESDLPF